MQSMFDERQWLQWLVKVRIIVLTFLLGIELAITQFTPTLLPTRAFVSAMVLWYTIALVYMVVLSFWQETRAQSLIQVITDLALTTLLIQFTGGIDSSLNFLYPLIVIVSCILLPRTWSYLTAMLAFLLYGGVLELNYFGVITSYSVSRPDLKSLQAVIFINLFAYLMVAYLAAQLANKLRQVGVQLQDTSGALSDLRVLHENIIQSISGGIITTGPDGHITLVNNAGQKLLEQSENELLGKPIADLFLDPLPHVEKQRGHGEVRRIGLNGYRKTFRVFVSMLNVPDRATLGYVYNLDDLTEIRRLEREVRMQDRLAAVGRLAAGIAHEIRNPLTSIAGSVQMLNSISSLTDEQKMLVDIVTRESERLNNIITDFLAYSRGKQYHFDRVDLLPLVEDTLTLLQNRLIAQNTGIHIVRNFQVKEAFALADGDKLKQVFWNFCENAVRAMKGGGTLTVSLEAVGEDWQVNFGDTGRGMTPQETERIFEPFQSGFEGGTGLGLAIVYQIVQAHEGNVWARSKPGQGTTFVLRLRRLAQGEQTIPKQQPESAPIALTTAAAAGAEGGARG